MNHWTPILDPSSSLARQAWDAVMSISGAIHHRDYLPPKYRQLPQQYEEPLLYAYLGLARDDQAWLVRAMEHLNTAIAEAPALASNPGLYGGICGLGWTIAHLLPVLQSSLDLQEEAESAEAEADLNEDVDAVIMQSLGRASWNDSYDLISGLVGVGAYFLERLPAGTSLQGLKLIVDHLEATARVVDRGIAWHSDPASLPDWQREHCPEGYYNLGVAHGIPGILYLLAEVAAAGVDDRATHLLEGGVEWLLSQKRPAGSASWFSAWVAPGKDYDSRPAWCYGDLGILGVLLQITRRNPKSHWRNFTHELLEHCLASSIEQPEIVDAPLCHGATGVAHILNRVYQTEGDIRCRDAAVVWFDKALAMRLPTAGVGGFSAYTRPDRTGPGLWEASPAFLDGAMGIALALLSAVTPTEPQWDRLLLLSSRAFPEQRSTLRLGLNSVPCYES